MGLAQICAFSWCWVVVDEGSSGWDTTRLGSCTNRTGIVVGIALQGLESGKIEWQVWKVLIENPGHLRCHRFVAKLPLLCEHQVCRVSATTGVMNCVSWESHSLEDKQQFG